MEARQGRNPPGGFDAQHDSATGYASWPGTPIRPSNLNPVPWPSTSYRGVVRPIWRSRLYQFDKGSQRCVQARQGWQGQGSKPDGAIGRGAGAASKPTTKIVTPEIMSDKIDRKRQLISAWCS